MSCPSWFPRTLLASPEVFWVMRSLNATRALAPPGVWALVMGLTTGLEAGVYLARADCDSQRAACLWAVQQRAELAYVLESDELPAIAARAVVTASGATPFLRGLLELLRDPRIPECNDVDEENMEDENDLGVNPDPSGPMFSWSSPFNVPHVSANPNGLGLAYSHAYQRAAEETYRADPSANLRPWVQQQAQVDLAAIAAMLPQAQRLVVPLRVSGQRERLRFIEQAIAALGEAQRRLNNFAIAAGSEPLGAWSRETVLRVLRSSEMQSNLPVVGGDGEEQGDGEGGGSGALLLAGAAAVLGLLTAR